MSEKIINSFPAEQYPYQVKGWNKFQHYGNRAAPPWIKLYRSLLDNPDFHALDDWSARLLVSLWLIASEASGYLPASKVLAFRLRRTEDEILSGLSRLYGFIEHRASNVLAKSYQDAMPEERRVEEKSSSLRSEGAPPAAEPLTEAPWDDSVPEDKIFSPAADPPELPALSLEPKPDPALSAKSQMFAWARALMGPQGGMVLGRMQKMWPSDWLKIRHILLAAEALKGSPEDAKKYCLGALAKEKKLRDLATQDAKLAEQWQPNGVRYPDSDERGFYIKNGDNSRKVYLDGDRVQQLVGAERQRRGAF